MGRIYLYEKWNCKLERLKNPMGKCPL